MAAAAKTRATIFVGGRLRLAVPNSSLMLIPGPGPRSMPRTGAGSRVGLVGGGDGGVSSGIVASHALILYGSNLVSPKNSAKPRRRSPFRWMKIHRAVLDHIDRTVFVTSKSFSVSGTQAGRHSRRAQ